MAQAAHLTFGLVSNLNQIDWAYGLNLCLSWREMSSRQAAKIISFTEVKSVLATQRDAKAVLIA
jgi:hypothetical protein